MLSQEKEIEGGPQMRALIRAGRELAGNMPLAELFKLIMNLSVEAVGATRGVLMTLEGKELVVQAALGEGFRISNTVRDRVIKEKTSLLVRDARLDEAFADRMSIVQQQIRSMLAVPLQTDDRVIGLIYLDSPHFIKEFTKDDLSLLTVMANVAAIRIEHTRLAEVEQAERMHAKQLEQAAEIQRGLLPVHGSDRAGSGLGRLQRRVPHGGRRLLRFLAVSRWARRIAGGRRGGEGNARGAADVQLAGARASAVRRPDQSGGSGYAPQSHHLLQLPFEPVHHVLHWRPGSENRRTDVRQRRPQSAAGGARRWFGGEAGRHRADPGHFADGDLSTRRLPSGPRRRGAAVQRWRHRSRSSRHADEEFGEERLAQVLAGLRDQSAESIIASINQKVEDFTGGAPPADDITLVVAKRLAN